MTKKTLFKPVRAIVVGLKKNALKKKIRQRKLNNEQQEKQKELQKVLERGTRLLACFSKIERMVRMKNIYGKGKPISPHAIQKLYKEFAGDVKPGTIDKMVHIVVDFYDRKS